MITHITSGATLVALHISNADIEDGTHPITESAWPLQMLMMKRNAGHIFAKHTHQVIERPTSWLQEAVVVTKGALRVTVCTRAGEDIGEYLIKTGECLFLVDGGYKIEVTEDAAFYEFKNGPHSDDKVML